MKTMKKTLALLMAVVMCMSLMSMAAFANESSQHTIKIQNTDQNVSHTYEGYQIFVGKLDDTQKKLSDIQWGSGVDGDALITALKASGIDAALKATEANVTAGTGDNAGKYYDALDKEISLGDSLFKNCTTAADVATVLATFASTNLETQSAGAIDAVAKIIGETSGVLKAAAKISFTESNKEYTATVTGDGYYFVKDVTTALTNPTDKTGDTLSKYLLEVVKDTTVVAKDTGLTPDKEILGTGNTTVKTGTAAVGDTVTFQVTIPVPDTRKYVDHFIFDMKDKLPDGMTFMGISSVKVGTADVPYTLTVAPKGSNTYAAYTAPTSAAAAVTADGGQQIKLVFNDFKTFAEGAEGRIGSNMVITYTAVVNNDADFTSTGNKNEVVFDYSNDPNHDYNGDEPTGDDVVGTTPKDETTTLLTNIEIQKTGDNGKVTALPGAEFEITSNDYNVTLVTGEKYVTGDYTAQTGETVQDGTWYKLKDGSYTTTAPTTATASSYDSNTTYKLVTFEKVDTTPGDAKKVTVLTGTNGKIILNGLKPGTYTIKETKAPSGYNLDSTEYTIVLKFDDTTKKIVLDTENSTAGVQFTDSTATATLTIDNKSGATLPETGGIGTKIFYTMGAVLVIGAGVVLVSRKRAAE